MNVELIREEDFENESNLTNVFVMIVIRTIILVLFIVKVFGNPKPVFLLQFKT
jgi:hypothetical protein